MRKVINITIDRNIPLLRLIDTRIKSVKIIGGSAWELRVKDLKFTKEVIISFFEKFDKNLKKSMKNDTSKYSYVCIGEGQENCLTDYLLLRDGKRTICVSCLMKELLGKVDK